MSNVVENPPHLLHVFATFVPAGPQLRTTALLREFGGAFRHTVVAMDGRTGAAATVDRTVALRCVEPPPKAGSLATAWRMRRLLARERPDLLLTYGFGSLDAIVAARTLGMRRVIHHEDGFGPDEAQALKRRRIAYRRLVLPWCHRVVVISENLRTIAAQRWRLAPECVAFIPNGIHVERFEPADRNLALRKELRLADDAFIVGAVGHLRPEKNLPRLLRAAAADAAAGTNVVVLLVGDGPERATLVAEAERLGLRERVHFAGHHADPRPLYRMMDAFALSSDTEQMPMALLEAMASSLPIVATDVGDVRRMVPDDQQPFVVDARAADVDARLAVALQSLSSDLPRSHQLGDANRCFVRERFPFDRMVAAYCALISEAIGNGFRMEATPPARSSARAN